MLAPARLGASNNGAAAAALGAAPAPALRSLEVALLMLAEPEGPEGLEVLELFEGLEVVAQPVSHAAAAARKSDVIFM